MPTSKPAQQPKSEEELPPIDQDSMQGIADVIVAAEEEAQTNVVRYLGVASERRLSREDWETAGVPGQEGVVWTKKTGNMVPIDQFTEKALEALRQSGEFQILRDEE